MRARARSQKNIQSGDPSPHSKSGRPGNLPMPRVVSLIASATEIVCALGFEAQLVGRSHECDYPESVRDLPVCTEPKFDVSGPSADIDRRVKDTLEEELSVYRVHADKLRELRP